MHRTPPRLTRLLACAAVIPAVLVTGCSYLPGSDPKESSSKSASEPTSDSPSPTVAAAKYGKLPKSCSTLSKKTIEALVPKTKSKSGTTGKSADVGTRSTCSWNGLDGFQYRWLDVSLQRFKSDPTLGSGDSRAKEYFGKQVHTAKQASGAKNLKTTTAGGVGDQATTISYVIKKEGEEFKNQTVIARTANIVIILNYNGAGYEDAKTPNSAELLKDAKGAAKEVVAAVADANK
jgi:hypothetical protein